MSKLATIGMLSLESPKRRRSDTASTGESSSSAASPKITSPRSSQSQSTLLTSPSEIIHRVLCASGIDDPGSIARAAETCQALRSFVYENPDQALWRDIHLERFDDPRSAGTYTSRKDVTDWKRRVQDREFVMRIFKDDTSHHDDIYPHLDRIVDTLLEMYTDLPASHEPSLAGDTPSSSSMLASRNGPMLEEILNSPLMDELYLHVSFVEKRANLRPLPGQPLNPHRMVRREVKNPGLSRLHLLVRPEIPPDTQHRVHRGHLREMVYTGNNFKENNDYGPFTTEGKVDWALTDAVASVMMANASDVLSMGEDGWASAKLPLTRALEDVRGWGFNDLTRPSELEDGDVWDWAGVEGQWCGSYAFLDYADWISLNEPRLVQFRRLNNTLDLSRYVEAVGDLMQLNMKIDRPGDKNDPYNRHSLPLIETSLPKSELLPPIYFHGSSMAGHGHVPVPNQNSASFVRGVVQLTADDPPQVRWTLIIRYGGEDRWRLECVQPGGRGSRRGFFGIWTDAHREMHSPNGPIWYWKAEDGPV